ncbi:MULTISPECIES: hypothetical protein [Cyanophyceae]|jgi:hypothetical protein|uniref:Uncharacterized protein n=1 Tax=Stenomitos frigidus AS-A4 TaxID=2933935 RepID=A0ABV0KJX7_9CYAN
MLASFRIKAIDRQQHAMYDREPFENEDFKRLQLFLYLVPVVGFFPALWTLYRGKGTRQQKNLSRLVVTLALGWLLGYILLGAGANASESLSLPLLITSSLFTSGYFLVNLWLMVQLWRRKALRLPIVSKLGDRLP